MSGNADNTAGPSHPGGKTAAVRTIGLGKSYGPITALDSVDIAIDDNQYYVLLGPSGGGKTTLLRLIGGFVRASRGTVLLHGNDVTNVPPERRPTSMVFQSYALFPHMSVARNVGYGLRLKKLSGADIAKRTEQMLELVGLTGFGDRMPHELSGGQQQRVQLARSLVLERDILLLDEPLAALDAQLRKDMCFELKRIQQEVGITFIHVTHNQEEAMTVADQVALISSGNLVEEGSPRAMYEQPRRRFTAEFIGENNVFAGAVLETSATQTVIDIGHAKLRAPTNDTVCQVGSRAAVSLRSEHLRIYPSSADAGPTSEGDSGKLSGIFLKETYFGFTSTSIVRLPDGKDVTVRQLTDSGATALQPGQAVQLGWQTNNIRLHAD